MSHVAATTYAMHDLDLLERVCAEHGFELVRNQKTYKWWGYSVGDYPIPKGFTKEDMGKCEHMIRLKPELDSRGRNKFADAFEIGVVKNRAGEGYVLHFDFFGQQEMVKRAGGEDAAGLIQTYSKLAVTQHQDVSNLLLLQGYSQQETVEEETGDIIIILES